jgi:hypothetical protein
MKPATYNLELYEGDDFVLPLRLKDTTGAYFALTGYTGKAQIRATAKSDTVLAEFTCTNDPDQSANIGKIVLSLTSAQTTSLAATTNAAWDFQLTDPSGKVRTYLAGAVVVIQEVTRA